MRPKIRITNYYEFDGVYAFKADQLRIIYNMITFIALNRV